MRKPHLSEVEKTEIFELCDKALLEVIENAPITSYNLLFAANGLKNGLYNNYYGMIGNLSHSFRTEDQLNQQILENLQLSQKEIRALRALKQLIDEDSSSQLEQNRWLVNAYKIGHCGELSKYAFSSLMKEQRPIKIEFFEGDNYDHAFIVLGRPPDSDPRDFNTWPEDTVILDPWLKCKFLLKDLPEYWRDMGYYYNWGGMKSWEEVNSVMGKNAGHSADDSQHPFFTKLKQSVTYSSLHYNLNPTLEDISEIKKDFFSRYSQIKQKDSLKYPLSRFFLRTNVKKSMTLEEIIQHGLSAKNRTREVCMDLGWISKEGKLSEKGAHFIDAERKLLRQASSYSR